MKNTVTVTRILNWTTTVLATERGAMSNVLFSREVRLLVFHVDVVRCNFTVCLKENRDALITTIIHITSS